MALNLLSTVVAIMWFLKLLTPAMPMILQMCKTYAEAHPRNGSCFGQILIINIYLLQRFQLNMTITEIIRFYQLRAFSQYAPFTFNACRLVALLPIGGR